MKVTKAENLTSNTLSQIPTLIKRMNNQLFASGASIKPQKRHQIGVPNTPQKLNQIDHFATYLIILFKIYSILSVNKLRWYFEFSTYWHKIHTCMCI